MIQVIQWPPTAYAVFSLHGRMFVQDEEEPFVTLMLDGSVDTDLKRQTPGFVNRIQRYGIQNSLPREEWDEQNVYFSVLQRIPLELRGKFFRNIQSISAPAPIQMSLENVHKAPVPLGLAEAAGLGVAADDPDLPAALAQQNPDKWLATLARWVQVDPAARKTKTAAGPVWWWAAHSVALNPTPASTPLRFVGLWLGRFPCRRCRLDTRNYIAKHPVPGWDQFPKWLDDFHNFVTTKKSVTSPQ